MPHARRQAGFTMIELVISLVITALLLVGLLPFFSRPLEAMIAGGEAATAAENAERPLVRLAGELPAALPNSVRIACGGQCLEFIPVVAQADYRAQVPGDRLDFTAADDRFDVLMPLAAAPAAGLALVINNLSAAGAGPASAYSVDAVSNRGVIAAGTTAAQLRFASKLFPAPSPTQRFYVVATPVSYLCAPAANGGTLRRYAGYAIQAAQPVNTALGDLIASDVTDCAFTLADARLVMARVAAGSGPAGPVTLFDQYRLVNAP